MDIYEHQIPEGTRHMEEKIMRFPKSLSLEILVLYNIYCLYSSIYSKTAFRLVIAVKNNSILERPMKILVFLFTFSE